MSDDLDRFIKLELYTKSSNFKLLQGLDIWLQLGLIKESQVISLCRNNLTCSLPEIKAIEVNPEPLTNIPQSETIAVVETIPVVPAESQHNILVQIWQAFLDELSIRWLLFLGIFLVVVSSGVLAATQWHNFPDSGQYLILWGYTLSFYGIGYWLNRQENLRLTSQTLKNIAILLVPVNFWAMSSFSFGFNLIEWLIIPIAALSLTGITYLHYQQFSRSTRLWFVPFFLLLGYLHLGWQIPHFSLAAVYLGILAIVVTHHKLFKPENNYQIVNSLFLLATWILLLVRALFVVRDVNNFSLAIAAAGWLLAIIYLARARYLSSIDSETELTNLEAIATNFLSKVLQPIGIIIIIYGWFNSLVGELFWQTTIINLLAINLFDRRLRCYWRRRDLTAIFVIGLQALFVAKELIPVNLRIEFMNLATTISNQTYLPESVFSITLFPYIILFVGIASWLYRQGQARLALYSEWLNLLFGIILTILAFYNPTWRTVNLLLATTTLGYVSRLRHPPRKSLIYLTHTWGLLTLCSAIDLVFPALSSTTWGTILLFLTVGEWSLFLRRFTTRKARYLKYWYRSTWYFGWFLATISYTCFVAAIESKFYTWEWLWSIIPTMLTLIARSSRRQQRQIAANYSNIALFFLQFLTFWQPETRSFGLLIATGLVAVNTNYLPFKISLIYLTHGLGLLTIFSSIDWLLSPLSREIWGCILLLLAIAEWLILIIDRSFIAQSKIWRRSYWHYGLLLAAISYLCFLFSSNNYAWGYLWLLIPSMLTVVARYSRRKQKLIGAFASCIALVLVQILTFSQPETRLLGLVVANGLMFVNTYYLRHTATATLHIGFVLGLIANLLWGYISDVDWLVIGSISLLSLDLFRHYLLGFGSIKRKIKQKYLKAADYWSLVLLSLELIVLSSAYFNFALNYSFSLSWQYLLSSLIITVAIVFHYGRQPSQIALYTGAWTIELFVTSLITLTGGKGLAIATANIILALLSLWWINYLSRSRLPDLYLIPPIYAIIGILWRLPYFTASTGLLTLGASLTAMGISNYRGRENKLLSYFALAGITLSIYELVIYQMLQAGGGNLADGLTMLALVSAAIAFTYRLLVWWRYRGDRDNISPQILGNLSLSEIILTAHLHWAIASILKIIAATIAIETQTSRLNWLSIAVSCLLAVYAISQGRNWGDRVGKDWWVYFGLVEFIATIVYSRLIITKLSVFDPWRVIFTCAIALIIYQIPWQNFGWRSTPWRHTAIVVPALVTLVIAETVSDLSLLATAIFYLRIAYHQRNLRWSYLSLAFINWAVMRVIWTQNLEFIWLAIVFSLSILYIAQFDPYFQSHKPQRHYLRLAASGFTCLVALLLYRETGVVPSVISIALVFVGLGLRIRAFLYVGTITFILTIIYQLIVLVFTYSFLKWIVGLVAGIISIIIAANFESKRGRITDRWQSYFDKLQEWQ